MQAIVVKFLSPGNVRGSRYKATAAAGSLTLDADQSIGYEANIVRVAVALCKKLGWGKPWYGDLVLGGLPDGRYVFAVAGRTTAVYDIETGALKAEDRT